MLPQDLLFKAQESVTGCGIGHRICFQLLGGCFHYCKHTAFAEAGLWEGEIVLLSDLLRFKFQPSSFIPKRFYLFGLSNYSICFTFVDNLCNSVHVQIQLMILSPSICCTSSLMAQSDMAHQAEILHPHIVSPNLPEPLESWWPNPPAGCFDA